MQLKMQGMDVVYGNLGSEKGFKVDAQALGDSSKYLKAEIAETTAISCKVGDEPLEVEVDKDFENGSLSFLGQVHKMEKLNQHVQVKEEYVMFQEKTVTVFSNQNYMQCVALKDGERIPISD